MIVAIAADSNIPPSGKLDLGCPKSAPEALYSKNRDALIECDAKRLRLYYNDNACCINNIAECNYIAAAYELRRNILDFTPICKTRFFRAVYDY